MITLHHELTKSGPSERLQTRQYHVANVGSLAVNGEHFTFGQLDSSFDTGKVAFIDGMTYFDGQPIVGVNKLF